MGRVWKRPKQAVLLGALGGLLASMPGVNEYIWLYSAFNLPVTDAQRQAAQHQLQLPDDPIRRGAHGRVAEGLRSSGLPFVYPHLSLLIVGASRDVRAASVALRDHVSDLAASILDNSVRSLQDLVVSISGAAVDTPSPATGVLTSGTSQGTVSGRAAEKGAHT